MKVFTTGYGGRGKDELLALMHSTVVDIRPRPDGAKYGHLGQG
jgi:hypothetical protein